MPSFVEMKVGSSKRLRLYATHGPTITSAPRAIRRSRTGATRPACGSSRRAGAPSSGASSTSSARERGEPTHDADREREPQRRSSEQLEEQQQRGGHRDGRERLGHDEPVVHPEVRVDRRDPRRDEPGAVARQLAPEQPDQADRAQPDQHDLEAHHELRVLVVEPERVADLDRRDEREHRQRRVVGRGACCGAARRAGTGTGPRSRGRRRSCGPAARSRPRRRTARRSARHRARTRRARRARSAGSRRGATKNRRDPRAGTARRLPAAAGEQERAGERAAAGGGHADLRVAGHLALPRLTPQLHARFVEEPVAVEAGRPRAARRGC